MTFNEMNIPDNIKSALTDMGFTSPTPVQAEVIPLLLEGHDVLAQAPTGTGKTCAFGIPAICNIDTDEKAIQAIILCPTRELVVQIERELAEVLKYTKEIQTVSIYGGDSIDKQMSKLRRNPHIVIGTTGRVMDHMRRKTIKLDSLKMLVLDEVDEMLNMGFKEDVDTILQAVPKGELQTILFSATVPKEIEKLSREYQTQPLRVTIAREKSETPLISQYYVKTDEKGKMDALSGLLRREGYMLSLVFCKTKKRVEEIASELSRRGFACDVLHGDLLQRHRDRAMKKFREGKTEILVATDVAARGIDVDNIQAVFNYDLPQDDEYYVHRIGRTARANKTGASYVFVSPRQMYLLPALEKITHGSIEEAEVPAPPVETKISDKRYKKAAKIIRKEDLTEYKEYILSQIDLKDEKVDPVDLASAFLMMLSRAEAFEAPMPAEREKKERAPKSNDRPEKSARDGERPARTKESANSDKFFLNVGTADKMSDEKMLAFVMEYTNIAATDVLEIIIKDTFSFVKVRKERSKELAGLSGAKYNKRNVVVDLCDDNGPKKAGNGKNFKSGGKNYAKTAPVRGDKPTGRYNRDRESRPRKGK